MSGPRLKDLGRWYSGGTPPSEKHQFWDGDVPWLSGKDFERTRLREPTRFITADGARRFSRRMPARCSILVLVRGMALAHGLPIARLPFDAAINQDVRGLLVDEAFDPGFTYYALLGRRAMLDVHIDRAAHGTARARETLYVHRIDWMPALVDQQRIADFLDHECELIDAASAAAQRPAYVATTLPVRRLLDDIALLRPPSERLRFGLQSLEQGWSPECWDQDRGPDDWGVLKLSCVNGGTFTPDHKTLPHDVTPRPELEVIPGDLLMSRANTRSLVGSATVVPRGAPLRLMLSDLLYRLRLRDDRWHAPFVAAVVNSPIGRAQIEAAAIGSSGSMPKISQAVIRELRLPRPDVSDQAAIAQRYSACHENVHRLAIVADQARGRLDEYRNSLIYDAVTGKLDVSRLSEAEMDERLHAVTEDRLGEVAA